MEGKTPVIKRSTLPTGDEADLYWQQQIVVLYFYSLHGVAIA